MSRSSYRGYPSRSQVGSYNAMGEETETLEDCVVIADPTDKAVLVRHEGSDYWIPFSQIDPESSILKDTRELEKGDTGSIIIPSWLAREKGIV